MVDYSLAFCYGMIIPNEKVQEISNTLTDEEYDEMGDNYLSCLNSWTGGDYFLGISDSLSQGNVDFVYFLSDFSIPSDNDENLINFKQFFTEHHLDKIVDWKPEPMLINFCS